MRIFVSLIVVPLLLLVTCLGCKKSTSDFPQKYIAKMTNVRIWDGTDYGYFNTTVDTGVLVTHFSVNHRDTFAMQAAGLAVSFNDPKFQDRFGCFSGNFTYDAHVSDTRLRYLTFVNISGNQVRYYYAADSIIIKGGCGGAQGQQTVYIKTVW